MIKVLFVCLGNICRSPMAEFIFRDIVKRNNAEDRFLIESAATHTDNVRNGVGAPVYRPAAQKLRKHGISCEGKRARLLNAADYSKFDCIIGMEERNLRDMKRILGGDPDGKIKKLLDFTDRPKDIDDPWYTDDFDTAYREIREGCEALYAYLTRVSDIKMI